MFRKLKADEIEVRVQSVKEKGVVLLLYKDARCDMRILDETVGPLNWKREHIVKGQPIAIKESAGYNKGEKEVIKGQFFSCIVSIYNEKTGEWISKEDTGNESNTDEIKGLYSDSFKRACFNWGIGRELYTSPFLWVESKKCNIKSFNNKFSCSDKFFVQKITYDEAGSIKDLIIYNENTKSVAFSNCSFGNNKNEVKNNKVEKLVSVAMKKGFGIESVKKKILAMYKKAEIEELSNEEYSEFLSKLESLEDR